MQVTITANSFFQYYNILVSPLIACDYLVCC